MVMARDSGGGSYRPVPAGVHVGRCIRVIDLGTQTVEYQGSVKLQRKVAITWECFGEDEAGQPLLDDNDKPLTVTKRYTLSLSDKARLRQDLAAWRGRDFTADELKGFDLEQLLEKYCMLNIVHDTPPNGKTYANVQSITPLPAAMRKNPPAGVHGIVLFDVDKPDMAVFDEFHEKLQEVIKASVEWKARTAPKAAPAPAPAPKPAAAAPKAQKDAKPTGTAFDTMPDDDLQDVAF